MGYVSGIYSGVECILYGPDQVGVVDDLLDLVVKSGNYSKVVSVCMLPHGYFSGSSADAKLTMETFPFPTKLDGYTPRNNKLLSFPFCFFQVDCINDVKNYKYELMPDYGFLKNFRWMIYGVASPNPELLVCPYAYDDISAQGLLGNPTVGCIVSDFPQCAFPIDSYKAWVAQKSTSFAINAMTSAVGAAASVATGNLVGAGIGVMGLFNSINSAANDASMGSHIQGNQGGSATVGSGTKGIFFKYMSCTAEAARSIDDFFDRYGYATERLKVPNTSVRPHWTYTKTKDCAIGGNVPAFYARKIEEVFNKGVTFWRNIDEVGNFSLNNSV